MSFGCLQKMQRVVGHLEVEGFLRLHLLCHERGGAVGHAEDVHGIRIDERIGVAVAGVAVADIVAVPLRPSATEMPFAKMRGGVTRPLQHLTGGAG